MAQLRDLLRKQRKSSTKEVDTATAASTERTAAETTKTSEKTAPETATAIWKECLLPAQLAVPSHPPPI